MEAPTDRMDHLEYLHRSATNQGRGFIASIFEGVDPNEIDQMNLSLVPDEFLRAIRNLSQVWAHPMAGSIPVDSAWSDHGYPHERAMGTICPTDEKDVVVLALHGVPENSRLHKHGTNIIETLGHPNFNHKNTPHIEEVSFLAFPANQVHLTQRPEEQLKHYTDRVFVPYPWLKTGDDCFDLWFGSNELLADLYAGSVYKARSALECIRSDWAEDRCARSSALQKGQFYPALRIGRTPYNYNDLSLMINEIIPSYAHYFSGEEE